MSEVPARILVADDEPGMREGCRRLLVSEGYEVETAPDGKAAFELFNERGDFAAALVDLKMPRTGGIDLVQKLRAADLDVLIVVITAHAAIDTAVEATKRGAFAYVPKPFTPDELLLPLKNGLVNRALAIETRQLRLEREDRLLELAYERSKSGTIIGCMTDGVIVVNGARQVVLLNAAGRHMLAAWSDLRVPAEVRSLCCAEVEELLEQAFLAGEDPAICSREVILGGRTYMVNAGPVTGPGEVAGAVAVLRDVTAMKRVQAAKSTFVTMVAHEVKAPLAAIENYISVVLGGAAGDPGGDRKKLERCAVRASALRQMISELAKLMEIEAGRTRLERRMTDLAGIVEDAVAHFREVADGKGVDLSVDPCVFAADLQIFADRDAMATVLRNSVDNAVKYTPDGGRVCVRADRDDCFLTISVVDTGIGMTGDERARVFDEFYRVRSRSTAAIPGTGLGLSIVKRLVEMHQGRIRVKSAPGAGSDFAVSLPVPPCAGR